MKSLIICIGLLPLSSLTMDADKKKLTIRNKSEQDVTIYYVPADHNRFMDHIIIKPSEIKKLLLPIATPANPVTKIIVNYAAFQVQHRFEMRERKQTVTIRETQKSVFSITDKRSQQSIVSPIEDYSSYSSSSSYSSALSSEEFLEV